MSLKWHLLLSILELNCDHNHFFSADFTFRFTLHSFLTMIYQIEKYHLKQYIRCECAVCAVMCWISNNSKVYGNHLGNFFLLLPIINISNQCFGDQSGICPEICPNSWLPCQNNTDSTAVILSEKVLGGKFVVLIEVITGDRRQVIKLVSFSTHFISFIIIDFLQINCPVDPLILWSNISLGSFCLG